MTSIPTTPRKYSQTGVLCVLVGPGSKKYEIHADLASQHSRFFESCNKEGFAEGVTKKVMLSEDDPDAFDIIVDWLYGQEIDLRWEQEGAAVFTHIKAYNLADKLIMTTCKNELMDILRDHCAKWAWPICGKFVARLEVEGLVNIPMMRKYIIKQLAYELNEYLRKLRAKSHEMPGGDCLLVLFEQGGTLVAEVMQRLYDIQQADKKDTVDPSLEKGCVCHDHDSVEDTNLCKHRSKAAKEV